ASWQRPAFEREAAIDRLVGAVHQFAALTAAPASERDNLFLDTAAARRVSEQIRLEQAYGRRDADGWESRLVDLARDRGLSRGRRGYGSRYNATTLRADVVAARDALSADLLQFRTDADADLAACLQQELAGATE